MSFRTRYFLLAGTWTALVAALLVLVPLAFEARLPHPVATHWGPGGQPDDAAPFWGMIAFPLGLWLAIAVTVLILAWRWGVQQRYRRVWPGAVLAGGGAFVLGLMVLTVWANLDVESWQQARTVNWQIAPVFVASGLAGWLGWLAARHGPEEPREIIPPPRTLPLSDGERAVWISSSGSNAMVVTFASMFFVFAAAFGVGAMVGVPGLWTLVVVFSCVGLIILATSSVRTKVTAAGLSVGFGPLGWPVRRIPLEKIDSAYAQNCNLLEVGGIGLRWIPGRWTIMIRSGECLIIRYPTGSELGISVDDAERGAALLNTLAARSADRQETA